MTESFLLSLHIARRNWAVYRKDFFANISPTVADPLFFIFSLGLGLGPLIPEVAGKKYLVFLAPGLAASTAMMTSFFEAAYGFYVRMTYENVYRAMLTTPINPREVVIGEFIWLGLKGAVMTTGVSLVFAAFGAAADWRLLPLVAPIGALVAVACGGIGLSASGWVRNINQFQTVYSLVIAPLFFFSGIFFPLSELPAFARGIVYLFPLAHGVKLSQAVFWNENLGRAFALHGGILILQAAVLGVAAFRSIDRRLTA
jgi:lipooligosaccharide transport system permease protein